MTDEELEGQDLQPKDDDAAAPAAADGSAAENRAGGDEAPGSDSADAADQDQDANEDKSWQSPFTPKWSDSVYNAKITDEQFERLSTFINSMLGIKMPPAKRTLLETRLRKRLRIHGFTNFEEYSQFVFSEEGIGEELHHMLDVVTTNKTDFFREPRHFEFLKSTVLPEMIPQLKDGRPLRIWSAGCSSGEEPYTISIVLTDYKTEHALDFDFRILATDVSTAVLNKAIDAIYKERLIAEIPEECRKRHFLRSKDRTKDIVRVDKHIREHVTFRHLNFMNEDYAIEEPQDIVFLRNVMIYFDRATQSEIINHVCQHLRPGGVFFIGHSETMLGIEAPLKQIGTAVYRRV